MLISLKQLNQRLFNTPLIDYPYGLAHGKMGLIIYLYHLWSYTNDTNYKDRAEHLLEDLLEHDLSIDSDLSVEEGLCGIALGLDYLIRQKFVAGDANKLLGEIDDLLFKQIAFSKIESTYFPPQLVHILYYIHNRLEIQTNDEERFPFEGMGIKVVDILANLIDASFFKESYTFSIYHYHVPVLMRTFSCLIQHDFYKERIRKILEQLSLYLFAHLPHLHLNRLYLLWGTLPLRDCNPDWHRYVDELRKSIDLNRIYEEEVKGRNIYISDGYAALYFLLEAVNKEIPEYAIPFNPRSIYDRILSSDAWDALIENKYYYDIHRGLLNGFPGVELALLNIKQKYLCE